MTTRFLALVALVALGLQAAALAALHMLPSDLDPMVHFVSEYVLGPTAWIQNVATAANFAAVLSLLGALRVADLAPRTSWAFALLSCHLLSQVAGFVFPVDPVAEAFASGGRPDFTGAGWIHVLAGVVAAITIVLAMANLTIRLRRCGWLVRMHSALVTLSLIAPLLYGLMLATPPAVSPAGLYQRLFMGSTWLWLALVSSGLRWSQLPESDDPIERSAA